VSTHVIKVPDIGEGIAEVELVEWLVKTGDLVTEDQGLALVMTEKASVEIPSPVAGTVAEVVGKPGQMLAVGAVLIRIETAAVANVAPASPAAEGAFAHGDKPLASPSVRRHARELGVDLRSVPGSGPGGRVRHDDVERFAARAPAESASADRVGGTAPAAVGHPGATTDPGGAVQPSTAGQPAAQRPPVAARAERHDVQVVPVIGLRRRIAERMQLAKRHIPHFSYVEEVDVTELEALRTRLNEKHGAARPRLTFLPFLLCAIVLAVREFPQINAHYDDEGGVVSRYGAVHAGIATQTDAGLMVPVLRHAEARDLWDSAAEIARLSAGARNGKALREELSGSTITITSLGALGGIVTTPVINRPEVAIVGVNRIVERPVIRAGLVVARSVMNLSSSFDHRVVDGMHAAQFVQALRGYLECPATMFVD
jgi:2-oxoisovalerate dehydrogenase E2 component (dihydrolipoyl transacylase)